MKRIPPAVPGDWPARPEFDAMPATLREQATWAHCTPGAVLFRRADRPRTLYFVVEGEIRLRRISPDGMEIVLQRARHSFLAEASITSHAYHCDAVVTARATAIGFPILLFRQSLDACKAFRDEWNALLMRELRRSRAQCERMALGTAAARILHYIDCEGIDGRLELQDTRKSWAVELGLTHEALYRTLARLQRAGTIVVDGSAIVRS